MVGKLMREASACEGFPFVDRRFCFVSYEVRLYKRFMHQYLHTLHSPR